MALIDLNGKRFGRLLVLAQSETIRYATGTCPTWKCVCDCGEIVIVHGNALRSGHTQSCGCLHSEVTSRKFLIHGATSGGSQTPEYKAWIKLRERCSNSKVRNFHNYGGRGIAVCARWETSFENFIADMGHRPTSKHSIDRYPDKNGDYEPNNCRWATSPQQGRNRRNNHLLTVKGVTKTIAEWAEDMNLKRSIIGLRLRRGWDAEKSVLTPSLR